MSHQIRTRMLEATRRVLGGPEAAVQAAALPWRKTDKGIEIMMVTSRGTGRWVLPKGWPEKGETLPGTASREAGEEAGIEGRINHDKIGTYFYDKVLSNGALRRCIVHVYALKVKGKSSRWPEARQRRRAWFSPAEAAGLVDERDLAELLNGFTGNLKRS